MKVFKILSSSILVFLIAVASIGCGSGGGGSSSSNLTGSSVPITNTNEAMLALEAIAAPNSIVELATTDLSVYTEESEIPHSVAAAPALAPVNTTLTCQRFGVDTQGKVEFYGDLSDTSVDMTYTYNECWINDQYRLIGEKTMKGSVNDTGYAVLNFTTDDYYMVGQYKMNTSATVKFYPDDSISGVDILLSGKINSYSMNGTESVEYKLGYENFNYIEQSDGYERLSGKASIYGWKKSCADGIYNFETVEPIAPDMSSGKVKVNGTTYGFNSDGTVSLTFADNSTGQFSFEDINTSACTQ